MPNEIIDMSAVELDPIIVFILAPSNHINVCLCLPTSAVTPGATEELSSNHQGTPINGLENLQSQWPSATGLKYRNENTGRMVKVLKKEGKLHPLQGGWEAIDSYIVTVPAKPAPTTLPV